MRKVTVSFDSSCVRRVAVIDVWEALQNTAWGPATEDSAIFVSLLQLEDPLGGAREVVSQDLGLICVCVNIRRGVDIFADAGRQACCRRLSRLASGPKPSAGQFWACLNGQQKLRR